MIEIRLREILKQRGISIKAFADKLGVGPNSLPISVTFSPSLSSLNRYAMALNIPAVELVHEPDVPTPVGDGMDHCDAVPVDVFVMSRILEEMRIQNLNKKQVAEKMGVSAQSLSQTIKKNKMSAATLDKIATAMGVETWRLFVPREEEEAPQPTAFDTHDPSEIQTVTEPCHTKGDGVDPLGEQLRVDGSFEDLFAQQPEQVDEPRREVVMQEGVTYVCGNTRITIVNGVMEIRVQDKKEI